MKVKISSDTILKLLFLLTVFLLAFNKIHDSDAWMHLSLGKYIWNNQGLPATEPFVYPNFSQDFSYTSWLFALSSYLIYLVSGTFGLGVFKGFCLSLTFFFMLQDSLRPEKNIVFALFLLPIGVILSQHRFVLRPDILLMLYLSFVIFALNAYLYEKRRFIYLLPVVLLLWANTHSSVNLIFAPIGAFVVGSLIQQYLNSRNLGSAPFLSGRELKTLLFVVVLSFIISLVNPNTLNQYIAGARFLDTEFYKQEISELLAVGGITRTVIYVMDIMIFLSFCWLRKKASVIHFLLVVPFFFMPFLSFRFLILTVVVGMPILIRNILQIIRAWGKSCRVGKGVGFFVVIIWLFLYVGTALLHFGPAAFLNSRNKFGFGFDLTARPQGAVEFMNKVGIYGRVLNPYTYGQYIIWTGYPDRTVFVDARGGLPKDLLEYSFLTNGVSINKLYKRFHFESVLKPIGEFESDNKVIKKVDFSFKETTDWALVYWDDTSLLYLKRDGNYDDVIRKFEYKYIKPGMKATVFMTSLGGYENRQKIADELKQNIARTDSDRAHLFLGILYYSSRDYQGALAELGRVVGDSDVLGVASANAKAIMGDIYFALRDYKNSLYYYTLAPNHEYVPGIMFNIGRIHAIRGEFETAAHFLEDVISLDQNFLAAYPELIASYTSLGLLEKAALIQGNYQKLGNRQKAIVFFEQGVVAQNKEDYTTAIEQYRNSLRVNPNSPVVWGNLGFALLDSAEPDEAFACFTKAVTLKEDFGSAYYGLGLVYQDYGASGKAIENFRKYCELAPTGYFYRHAGGLITELQQPLTKKIEMLNK